MADTEKRTYHHGNLRDALIEAAFEHLQEDTLDSLSLRGLARRVGVTPAAVYNHFSDKTALLVDLKAEAFGILDQFLLEAVQDIPPEQTEQRIRAMGHAYLAFAQAHPSVFKLTFNWAPDLDRLTEEFMAAGSRGELFLRQEILAFLRQHNQQPDDYQSAIASLSAWSMVHGLTSLLMSKNLEAIIYCHNWPEELSARDSSGHYPMLDHLIDLTLAGLREGTASINPPE